MSKLKDKEIFHFTPTYKETQEERYLRARSGVAVKHHIFKNKKKYDRNAQKLLDRNNND